jgi:hypothetical protein
MQHARTVVTCVLVPLITLVSEGAEQPAMPDVAEADVIVLGFTPGRFCAAIAAAREGSSVILLEPTEHVGGVNTGGLSFSDSIRRFAVLSWGYLMNGTGGSQRITSDVV